MSMKSDAQEFVCKHVVAELNKRGIAATYQNNDINLPQVGRLFGQQFLEIKLVENDNVYPRTCKPRLHVNYDQTVARYRHKRHAPSIYGTFTTHTSYQLGDKFQVGKLCDKIEQIIADQQLIDTKRQAEQKAYQVKATNSEKALDLVKELELPANSKFNVTFTENENAPFNVVLKFQHLTKFQVLALYSIIMDSGLIDTLEKVS